MLDRMRDGLFAVDRDLVVTHHNRAAARLAGREGEWLVGRRLMDLFPHGTGSLSATELHSALTDQEVVEAEYYSPFLNRWVWRRLYPGDDGVTVIFGESALPRAAEEEVRASLTRALESETRYRYLLDGMAEGVAETTPKGQLLAVNRAFAVMLGYDSPDDLRASVANAEDLYAHPDERPAQLARVARESFPVAEVEMRRKDGTHIWTRVRNSPRRAVTGEISSIQTIVEDISDLRYSGQELRQISERIEERERMLLAESVHDDPLQLIVAALLRIDTLQKVLQPSQAQTVEQIALLLEQAVERLRHLITALTPPDLSGGLGEALLQAAGGIFVGTQTAVEIIGPRHVPLTQEVKADCYRVLREALVNARKHSNSQRVTIELRCDEETVTLSISDDGDGAEVLDAGPGHLGVALMQARSEALGAHLRIDSTPGLGTKVLLVLPQAAETSSANELGPAGL